MSALGFLFISIISEVFASSMLKLTNGFKRLFPSIGVAVGYGTAFYFFSNNTIFSNRHCVCDMGRIRNSANGDNRSSLLSGII